MRVKTMKAKTSTPFLQGNFAPWPTEGDFENIAVVKGEVPKELSGALYRNGPNPQFPVDNMHWFEGDGMLHAFYINNGKISYRNRWVRTDRFNLERNAGKSLFGTMMDPSSIDPSVIDVSRNPANTNIIQHAGKLFALLETASPIEINPLNLDTLSKWDANGKVSHMSAHPHFDHKTGEMHNYAYKAGSTEVIYYVFNREGVVTRAETIHAPFSSFLHDFFITEDYVLFTKNQTHSQ